MSLFSWFTRKPAPAKNRMAEPSGLLNADATVPLTPGRGGKPMLEPVPAEHAANRKNERMERRELLYSVVRDAMVRAAVLSASYKFKVLSLDRRGTRFLVMVDVARSAGGDTARLSEIEAMMAQTCKARHGIQVSAVYWRMHDHVAVGVPQRMATPKAAPTAAPTRLRPDQVADHEVAAFRQALAGGAAPGAATHRSAPPATARPTSSVPGWERDERAGRDTVPPGLGTTQYGDLQ